MTTFATLSLWRALALATSRELGFGLRAVRHEVRHWQALADRIPDPALRHDAVSSLADKRYYTDGAAFFWILPRRRNRELLALLVALQTIANYLDYASEREAARSGRSSGKNLMLALVDAVNVGGPLHDYYNNAPGRDDGGYLRALVDRCRRACATLPRYELARPLLLREARRMEALDLCHDPVPWRRDAALRRFAQREFPEVDGATWQELAGSATSMIAVIALLALAADETCSRDDLAAVAAVYAPWVGALSLILDSYIDQDDDAVTGAWSFVTYFDSDDAVRRRGHELIERAMTGVGTLPHADRHKVVLSAMLAMFLTSDSARRDPLASDVPELLRAGGPLTLTLAPILRAWRLAYRQRN
jgi:tetraprenyl-beta-curcumene synthase